MNIQIMGTKKDRETQKTQRWFKERSIKAAFRDLAEKELSPRELESVTHLFPAHTIIDENSKAFKARQLSWKDYDPIEEILEDSLLVKMPIVRNGSAVTLGFDPDTWKTWLAESDK